MSTATPISEFCAAFERALSRFGVEGREEIVAEIRAHLQAAETANGLDAALAELGTPDDYARAFHDELRIEDAYANPAPHRTVMTLVALSGRRLVAAIGLFFTGIAYVIAFGFVLTIGLEIIMPDKTGLWINDETGYFAFGTESTPGDRAGYTERLGWLYIPVAIAFANCFTLLAGWMGHYALGMMRGAKG